ncbi:hypothetical protein LDENG_00251730, partial [Lucifuga dentata]
MQSGWYSPLKKICQYVGFGIFSPKLLTLLQYVLPPFLAKISFFLFLSDSHQCPFSCSLMQQLPTYTAHTTQHNGCTAIRP